MVFTSPLTMCSDILEVSISWYPPFEAKSWSATSTPTTATTIQNHGPRMKRFTVVTSGAAPRPPRTRPRHEGASMAYSDGTRVKRTDQRVPDQARSRSGHAQSRIDGRREGPYAAQVAVALVVVQAVADDEGVRDVEADVLHVDRHLLGLRLAEQREDLDRGWAARVQVRHQPREGQSGVDDVLDDQHVAAADVGVEVLEDPHDAGGLRAGAVRRHR